ERAMLRLRTRSDPGFQILVNGLLLLVLIGVAVPLWRVSMMAVSPLGYIDTSGLGLYVPPWRWSFEAFRQLLTQSQFLRATSNSLIITFGGTALNLALTVPLAYALSVRTLPGRRFFIGFILLTYLFSAGLVPTYLVVQRLGLIDSLLAVILPTGVNVYSTLVMKGFFEGLPEELKEAARIDGASEL